MATLPRATSLAGGTLLWHGKRAMQSPITQRMLEAGAFGEVQRESHSFGLTAMRVLDGTYVSMLRGANGHITPWDDTPVEAMRGELRVFEIDDRFREVQPHSLETGGTRKRDVLYVHKTHVEELSEYGRVETLR